MYYPYFRGKQFELTLLREKTSLLATSNIHPIIEPVKKNLSPLERTIQKLIKSTVYFTVVINPKYGDLKGNTKSILDFISDHSFDEYKGLYFGIIIKQDTDLSWLKRQINNLSEYNVSIIHYGCPYVRNLLPIFSEVSNIKEHIFVEKHSNESYRVQFFTNKIKRILIRDGFRIMRSDNYPNNEHFSNLHLTYRQQKMDSYGDFLIVGDFYNKSGGNPYAVTIHITYFKENNDMYIRHFMSERADSFADTPGKYFEALDKLVHEIQRENSVLFESEACREYIVMHNTDLYRGLGYNKKLSMQHHLELMADFLSR